MPVIGSKPVVAPKPAPKPKLVLSFRLRKEVEDNLTTVWLMDGKGITSGLMHGVIRSDIAEELAKEMERLGVAVSRDENPYKYTGEPRPSSYRSPT